MKINREWHEAHKLSRTTTLEERIVWHLKHAANCGCREIPKTIQLEIEGRGLVTPTPETLK